VTLYHVERCSGVGCSTFSEIATTTQTSLQNTVLSASSSYSYRVRAQDAALLLGPYGNTASATTHDSITPPVDPLAPIVDAFDRGNENPLAGGWTNGIGGSGETGLRVTSNELACTRNGVCSAWRPGLGGPDVEVWARVTTLPGRNNEIRLLGRVQQPGSAAYDAYMLSAIQRNGTDEVLLQRVDNGAITTRLTMPQELAVGDTLLLRVRGSALEAWLRRGTTWTRLGVVNDSTYAGAGQVGVGIRGKTGRLDDFGAR
jgi:hypothetical protein